MLKVSHVQLPIGYCQPCRVVFSKLIIINLRLFSVVFHYLPVHTFKVIWGFYIIALLLAQHSSGQTEA